MTQTKKAKENNQSRKETASKDLADFKKFMEQRGKAAQAYVSGDAEPLEAMTAEVSDATFFAPSGGSVHGAKEVLSRYTRDAKSFAPGGESSLEILQIAAADGIAYWTGFQRATAHLGDQPKAVRFNLRITEIFRRENGVWKLVHRHADPLASESNKK